MEFKYTLIASGNTDSKVTVETDLEVAGGKISGGFVAENLKSAAEALVKYIDRVVDELDAH